MVKSDVYLREVQPVDANLLLDWENNVDNWSVSDTNEEFTLTEIINLIHSFDDLETNKQMRWMIIESVSNRAVGAIDLFNIDFEIESGDVGILIASQEKRNLGFGLKALLLMEVLADELGVYNLNARVQSSNIASLRLFEKAGYEKRNSKNTDTKGDECNDDIFYEKWLEK